VRVVWTPEALQDRVDVWDYIAADNPRATARMDERFTEVVAGLADHPRLGRQEIVPGTLELISNEHHRLVYEIEGETVWILALVHTAGHWPQARGWPRNPASDDVFWSDMDCSRPGSRWTGSVCGSPVRGVIDRRPSRI
jgi:plasmid stabilization system protein ParE